MMLNPQVQDKIQEEIDRVIPKDVPIDSTMKNKYEKAFILGFNYTSCHVTIYPLEMIWFLRLPYTSAAVLEMFRHSTVIPAPTAREATEDFYFRGYLIRKGTAIVTNVHAVHFSESLWGDAKNFRPERFLNADGTGIDKNKADLLETFGAGKSKLHE